MTLAETLLTVWKQVLVENRSRVEMEGQEFAVGVTRARKLRTLEFESHGERLTGIEQNPETASRWAALARQGQRVMQFSCRGKYVANVAEGRLTRYPSWQALGLPE